MIGKGETNGKKGIIAIVIIGLLLVSGCIDQGEKEMNDPSECLLNQDTFCTEQNCVNTGGSWTVVKGLYGGGICRCDQATGEWVTNVGCQYIEHT